MSFEEIKKIVFGLIFDVIEFQCEDLHLDDTFEELEFDEIGFDELIDLTSDTFEGFDTGYESISNTVRNYINAILEYVENK